MTYAKLASKLLDAAILAKNTIGDSPRQRRGSAYQALCAAITAAHKAGMKGSVVDSEDKMRAMDEESSRLREELAARGWK